MKQNESHEGHNMGMKKYDTMEEYLDELPVESKNIILELKSLIQQAVPEAEEIFKSKETSKYYKISMDNRDLNYSKYFSRGEQDISKLTDYTSENTKLLNVNEIKNTLLSLDYIKKELDV